MPTGARSIVVVRAPKVDKLSSTPAGSAAETTINGVIILPRQTYEQGRGWITVDGWDIYILPSSRVVVSGTTRAFEDADIVSTDLIRINGAKWAVDGNPAPFDKGAKRKATLVKVKRVG